MTIIELMAKDQKLDIMVEPVVAAGDVESTKIHVEFSPEWSGYAKTAVFFTSNDVENVIEQVMTDNTCKVPHEVIETANNLFIGVRGVIASTGAVKTSTLVKYKIEEGAPAGTGTTVPPTADVYQQLLSKANDFDKRLSNLLAAETEDGEVKDIRYGADGKTYPTAGDAVREQFKNATEKQEANSAAIEGFLYPVTENITIAKLTSGTCWDTGYYSEIGTTLPEEIPQTIPQGNINNCFTWSSKVNKGDVFGLHVAAINTMGARLPQQCLLITNKSRVVVGSIPVQDLLAGTKYTAKEDGYLYLSGTYDSGLTVGMQYFWLKKYRDMSEIPSSGGVSQEEFEEEIGKLSKEIADLGGVVDYVKTEAKEVADKIINSRTANSLVLLKAADIHMSDSDVTKTAIKHMGQGMNEIQKYANVDGIIFLGDYNYDNNKDNCIELVKEFHSYVVNATKGVPTVFMDGNHDYSSISTNDTANRLSEDMRYALSGSHNTDKAVVDVDHVSKNYGYIDFEKQRIRLIYLNTTDCAEVDYSSHLISTAQGQWFASKALDLSDKEDEEKWGVVVCSHMPLFDNPQMPTVLGHFADRTSGRSFSQDYDFTNTKAELIGVFHGHLHNFKVTEKTTSGGNSIKYICIPNAVPGRENPYTDNADYNEVDSNGNSVSYPKTEGTAEDTTFNVVVIDKDNEKICAICYGAGYDREISYAEQGTPEVVIVNQIPLATDSAGAIYGADYNGDGVNDGYKEGIRLGSDGMDRNNASTDATGFIPAKLGDNVYLSNCQIVGDGTEYNEIAFYKSDKTFVRKIYTTASTITSGWDGVYDEANNLVQISLSALSAWGEGAEIAYIRITGNYIGADSIITVNQPIE